MAGFFVGAYKEAADSAGNYAVAHSAGVFVVDPSGRIREPVRWTMASRAQDIQRAVEAALEES
jgi:cytochrome oxidase Cu insertion factor (SCO1/SenC/PrrC family)